MSNSDQTVYSLKLKYKILNTDRDLELFPAKIIVDHVLGPIKCYRIIALREFTLIDGTTVKQGEVGGYVSSEHNLSQSGNCWIDKTSYVIRKGKLFDNVLMKNNSTYTGFHSETVTDSSGVEVSPLYGNDIFSENELIETPAKVEIDNDIIEKKLKLEELYPPEVRAQQKIKNDFMKYKLKDNFSVSSEFITKQESADNVLKSFSGMNEFYVIKDFNV